MPTPQITEPLSPYTPTVWVNNSAPAINDTNLNHIEIGIKDVTDYVIQLNLQVEELEDRFEQDLTDIRDRLTAVENEITNLKNRVSLIEQDLQKIWDEINAIKARLDSLENRVADLEQRVDNLEGEGVFLVGMIIAWGQTDIPQGWALCDGTNGTPDLLDRFIYGSPPDTIGRTGGYKEVQLAKHSHSFSVTTSENGAHSHTIGFALNDPEAGGSVDYLHLESPSEITTTTSTDGAHTHTISGETDDEGYISANSNLPPYYRLCYIMYIGNNP